MLKWVLGIFGGILLIAFLCFGYVAGKYNGFVNADQIVKSSWAQVENQLQRRFDLIPNLAETVKGYAKHEKSLFVELAKARTAWAGAQNGGINSKVAAANQLEGVLSRLMVVVENYPVLQASANFRALQDELAGTENRIAVERMRYNETVQGYNMMARSFPNLFFCHLFGFDGEKAFFKADEGSKSAPKVKFES